MRTASPGSASPAAANNHIGIAGVAPGAHLIPVKGLSALVSGLVSLLLAQDPSRAPAGVRRILATTSDKVGAAAGYGADPYHTCADCTWNASTGYGRIDARALSAQPAETQPAETQPASPPRTTRLRRPTRPLRARRRHPRTST